MSGKCLEGLERRAAGRKTAEQAASAPVHAEQAMEVPAHAVGSGDSVVRAVDVDDATEEVVDASDKVLGEAGDDMNAEEAFDAKDTTVSFEIAVEMLKKRAREESEEEDSAEEAELSVIEQLDGAVDIEVDDEDDESTKCVESDDVNLGWDDDNYDWQCSFCSGSGTSMVQVVEHRKRCQRVPSMYKNQFHFYKCY